ncbi:MAG: crossover junction endodeoxyribonuclease RuvC [Candidatus Pacebacteria bacterium]|nr:crossover junction endodeoxyribonuclease RuvC [Candidatus Paceibacterota bacterium]
MKVLSIDPGYERLGIAILEKENGIEKIIFSETFKTLAKDDFIKRMFLIGKEIEKIIKKYNPKILSIEKLFFNTNQKTATNVSEVRGSIIYIAMKYGLEVFEYTPLEIKSAVTGDGRADKKQMVFMVKQLIKIEKEVKYDDEWDAIAVGLTFFAYNQKIC